MVKRVPTGTNGVSAKANGLFANKHTWPDGTPKSSGNAFDWVLPPVTVEVVGLEAARERQRLYAREKYHRLKAKKVQA